MATCAILTRDRDFLMLAINIRKGDVDRIARKIDSWARSDGSETDGMTLPGHLPGGEWLVAEELPDWLEKLLAEKGALEEEGVLAELVVTNPRLA